MGDTKIYIIQFDPRRKLYRLVPEEGRAIRIKKDHEKYDWIKQQEQGRVVKINAAGRWTSSKDYNDLYSKISSSSNGEAISADNDLSNKSEGDSNSDRSAANKRNEVSPVVYEHLSVDLQVSAYKSLYSEITYGRGEALDDLLEEAARIFKEEEELFGAVPLIMMRLKVGFNRAKRICTALEERGVIKILEPTKTLYLGGNQGALVEDSKGETRSKFVTDVDPKSDEWPLLEKVTCHMCNGEGKTYSSSFERSGFLKLKTIEVQSEAICQHCDGKGFFDKYHYPYFLDGPKFKDYNLRVDVNFDYVAKEMLDKFITEDEFSRDEFIKALSSCSELAKGAADSLAREYSLTHGDASDLAGLPKEATWQTVQDVADKTRIYTALKLVDIEEVLKACFKLQLIDNSTRRRSTKDKCTYYKFTREAKKAYKEL